MATKSNIPSAMAASKDGEEEDIGALIYRESQFRKAEAAAVAASSATSRKNKTSTASQAGRISTRKRSAAVDWDHTSTRSLGSISSSKRKTIEPPSSKQDQPAKKVVRKKYRYECSADGCTNRAKAGGVCIIRHGAKVKRCSWEGCMNKVVNGRVCHHGAKVKRCSSEGCIQQAQKAERRSLNQAWGKGKEESMQQ